MNEELEIFPWFQEQGNRCPLSVLLLNTVTDHLARERQGKKRIMYWNGGCKNYSRCFLNV